MPAPLTHAKIPATMAPAAATGPGPLREAWHAIRTAVAEMNYATRRLTELQTMPLNRPAPRLSAARTRMTLRSAPALSRSPR